MTDNADGQKKDTDRFINAPKESKAIIVSTVVIAVATVVGVAMASFQWKSLDGQLKITQSQTEWLRNQTRAWVAVDIKMAEPIVFDARGAQIYFLVTVRNTGHSPAFKIITLPKVINRMDRMDMDIQQEQGKICEANPNGIVLQGSEPIFRGGTLFPGVDETQLCHFSVTPEELAHSKDFPGLLKDKLMLRILGCADYAIDSSGQRHQTFFDYEIKAVVTDEGDGFLNLGESVPLDKMFLSKDWTMGADAN